VSTAPPRWQRSARRGSVRVILEEEDVLLRGVWLVFLERSGFDVFPGSPAQAGDGAVLGLVRDRTPVPGILTDSSDAATPNREGS